MGRSPVKIEKDFIFQTMVELRFLPGIVDPDQTFFSIHNQFVEDYPKAGAYANITTVDDRFRFRYWAKPIDNSPFGLLFGENIFSVNQQGNYTGWPAYVEILKRDFNRLSNVISDSVLENIGIRFSNFIERGEVKKHLDFSVNSKAFPRPDFDFYEQKLELRALSNSGKNYHRIQILDNSVMEIEGEKKKGMVIDITTGRHKSMGLPEKIDDECFLIIDRMHDELKDMFFKLLDDDFIKQQNPVYNQD